MSVHRHNGEAPSAPRRLAERLQAAASIHTGQEFTQQRSNRWRFVLFPGPRKSPSLAFSEGNLRSGGRGLKGQQVKREVGQFCINCLSGPKEAEMQPRPFVAPVTLQNIPYFAQG